MGQFGLSKVRLGLPKGDSVGASNSGGDFKLSRGFQSRSIRCFAFEPLTSESSGASKGRAADDAKVVPTS